MVETSGIVGGAGRGRWPGAGPRGGTPARRLAFTVAAALLAALVLVQASGCTDEVTTTTTRRSVDTLIVAITEADDGRTIQVAPGWIVALQLTGKADSRFAWNFDVFNDEFMVLLPGPKVDYIEYSSDTEAVFTYTALALAEGTVAVSARYVSPLGKVLGTFECVIEIVSEEAMATTTTGASTTTTAAATTTTAPTTTTTTPPTTATTAAPTTSTTAAPTTTTLPPTTTTTVPWLPPLPPDSIGLGPKANGQVTWASTSTKTVYLALLDDPSSGYAWALNPVDPNVLRQAADPTFVRDPSSPTGSGARVWQFDVVATGPVTVIIEGNYVNQAGDVRDHYFTTVTFGQMPNTAN